MAAAVVSPVIGGIAVYFRFHAFYYDIGAVGLSLLGTVIAVGILAGLTFLAGMKPFAGKSREELMDEAKTLPDVLSEEIERFRSEHQKGQSAAGNMPGNMAENAAGGRAAGRPAPKQGTSEIYPHWSRHLRSLHAVYAAYACERHQ